MLEPSNNAEYELESLSPRCGKFYKVIDNETQVVLYGYLDHVVRLKSGMVAGYIYSPSGEQLGCKAVSKYATWYRLKELKE